jgi:pimeloyl-ACP methyl ester carboxylesterase
MSDVERTTVDGLEVAFVARGQGPTLILLHAFPLDQRMWAGQVEGLHEVAHVVTLDMPGFGSSQATDGTLSVDELGDWVHHFAQRLGHERFVLGGLSMGGYVALSCARRHPSALQGLVLADTRAGADSEAAKATRLAHAARVEAEGVAFLAETFPARVLTAATLIERPELVRMVLDWALAARPAAVSGALRMMASRPDATASLSGLRMPVLAIVGEGDAITPPDELEGVIAAVPDGSIARLPAAGHLSNIEQPAAFNQAVRAFLAGLPR